ncbi:triose-phosphate isomerase, partial [Candidatus Parcubacteria bacterium]|nr:triose-phosphate isomerase [Candidatus Parcubacteria bacterium]
MAEPKGKKTKIVIANWKMNPTSKEKAQDLFSKLKRIAKPLTKTNLIICPPAVYLGCFKKPEARNIHLGAQNIFWEHSGSFTGEMSTEMLKNDGVRYVIIGHSERRKLGETVEMVNKKLLAALRDGLTAILCIGEVTRDASGDYLEFLTNEIRTALSKVTKQNLEKIIIAYEPVWAIGKSERDAM